MSGRELFGEKEDFLQFLGSLPIVDARVSDQRAFYVEATGMNDPCERIDRRSLSPGFIVEEGGM